MTTPAALQSLLESAYDAAEKTDFAAFATAISATTPLNALPYVTTLERFRQRYSDDRRVRMLGVFDAVMREAERLGLAVQYMLCGGSFLDLARTPRDLDCVLFYRLASDRADGLPDLGALQMAAGRRGIDCRFIPLDGDPVVLIKSSIYFGILYAIANGKDAASPLIGRAPVLVSLES